MLTVQLTKDIQKDATCVFDVFLTKKGPDKFVGAMVSALPLIQAQALAGNTTGQKVESSQHYEYAITSNQDTPHATPSLLISIPQENSQGGLISI